MATTSEAVEGRTGGEDTRAEVGLYLLILIWGVNFPAIKAGLAEIPPFAFNALRFPLASLLLYLFLRRDGPLALPERADRGKVIALSVLAHVIYQIFFITGMERTTAGNASLLLAGTPMITALLSAFAGHERVGLRRWVGVLAAVAGMAIVVLAGPAAVRFGGASVAGDLIMIGASFAWSVYTVSARNLVGKYGALRITAWTQWLGTIGLIVIGLPSLGTLDWSAVSAGAWLSVLYAGCLGIGTAYMLWNYGVRHLGNTRTASQMNLVPVVALGVAWLWLGEVPTIGQLVGAVVIIGGVSLTRRRPGADARPRPAAR